MTDYTVIGIDLDDADTFHFRVQAISVEAAVVVAKMHIQTMWNGGGEVDWDEVSINYVHDHANGQGWRIEDDKPTDQLW